MMGNAHKDQSHIDWQIDLAGVVSAEERLAILLTWVITAIAIGLVFIWRLFFLG